MLKKDATHRSMSDRTPGRVGEGSSTSKARIASATESAPPSLSGFDGTGFGGGCPSTKSSWGAQDRSVGVLFTFTGEVMANGQILHFRHRWKPGDSSPRLPPAVKDW